MQIDFLFLLIAGIGTTIYVGYMVKSRKQPSPTPTSTPTQPEPQIQKQENEQLTKLTEKYTKIENELHDLKIAWKLQPKENKQEKKQNGNEIS